MQSQASSPKTHWVAALIGVLCWAPPAKAATFSNATPIIIPASGTGATTGAPASPYPSIISVTGIPANKVISGLTVTLTDFTHEFPDDVDILLIGPNGARVMLMSDAGAFFGVSAIDLTFEDAAGPLPDATAISAGTYRPTNYGTPDAFPAPVPFAPHGSLLGAFVNLQPNGDWSLFVVDDGEFDVGAIAGGWTLNLTTVATVCGNEVVELGEDCDDGNTVPGDGCGPTCQFETCGTGYVDAGEGCDDGNTTSGDGCSATCVVEFCGDGVVQEGLGESCEDGNTVGGDGCSAICGLEVCGNSIVDPGEDCDDGNTVGCDGCHACVFTGPPFCNQASITIPALPSTGSGAPADPYPSIIPVFGIPTGHVVSALTVTLKGLSHTLPDDVDVLLVGPDGTKVFLMSDAGGDADVVSVNLTFADGAAQLPDNTVLASGTYAPTNHGTPDAFPVPAPAGPYESLLSAFVGSNPSGNWRLYVVDDSGNFETGTMGLGWTLNVTTAFAQCGNGIVEPGEGCDDGNAVGGDGCSAVCNQEFCGNGIVDPGEVCDDGNSVPCDGCDDCGVEPAPVCGNGATECGEDCDDANANETDGCLADCTQGAAVPPPPPGCPAVSINSYLSTDTPISISAAGAPTIASTITVADAGAADTGSYIFDVNVTTAITHTNCGNLDITLTSPSGKSVTLTTDNGGANDNVFNGTVWDDQADLRYAGDLSGFRLATDAVYANGEAKGFLAPEEPLAAFDGENPNGSWTLTVSDDSDFDGGDLQGWTLSIATLPLTLSRFVLPSAASAPGLAIGPGVGVVTDTIIITDAEGAIGDIAVATNITHTLGADLDITITSPNGTKVTLTTDNAGPNDNVFAGTTWRDDADPGNSAPYPQPNPTSNLVTDTSFVDQVPEATLVPEEPLAAFKGENPNGTWTLTIRDDANPNGGTLNSWSLEITTSACGSPELCELIAPEDPLDPCLERQPLDCVGLTGTVCLPIEAILQSPDNIVATKCGCVVDSRRCSMRIAQTGISCNTRCDAFYRCMVFENEIPLNGIQILLIDKMLEGAMYRCDCVFIEVGDLDADGEVDLADLAIVLNCFGAAPVPPECERADFDGDGDVDLADFDAVRQNLTGPRL